MPACSFNVRGLVQGVGFRYFALRQAQALGLRGWVRNLPDGSVEVVAEGPDADLDVLEARLREGPVSSHVRAVERSPHPATRERAFGIQ
jgi:acylphosphatase